MPRATTTSDPFNAIAEPRRRALLEVLATGEAAVGELVDRLGWAQPVVSKHLGVLRSVDVVRCTTVGRHRLYSVHAPALKPVHDWVGGFEDLWNERYDRLDALLTDLQSDQPERPQP